MDFFFNKMLLAYKYKILIVLAKDPLLEGVWWITGYQTRMLSVSCKAHM